jgi:hypothetical protein
MPNDASLTYSENWVQYASGAARWVNDVSPQDQSNDQDAWTTLLSRVSIPQLLFPEVRVVAVPAERAVYIGDCHIRIVFINENGKWGYSTNTLGSKTVSAFRNVDALIRNLYLTEMRKTIELAFEFTK